MKKLLSIATLLTLAALPLAAQAPEPPAEQSLEPESEYGTQTQPVEESDMAPAEEPVESVDQAETGTEAEIVDAEQEELPRTASPLALIALLGGTGAAAGFGVRRLRTRRS